MHRSEYIGRVLACLHRLTPAEREAVRAELDAHMEDHICDLLELGYSEELAEERTMLRMGDPEEVGRELDKQYPLRWLIIGRIASVALAFAILVTLLGLSSLRNVADNLQARFDPWSDMHENVEERVNQRLDMRMEVGSDILRVMGSGTEVTEDGAKAVVVYCKYDRNPCGHVTHGFTEPEYLDCRGETIGNGSGGGHSSSGAEYWRRTLDVQYGDPYVTMVYSRFGVQTELEIPLKWEGET